MTLLRSPHVRSVAAGTGLLAASVFSALGPYGQLARAVVWAGVLLVSFIGWGTAVERLAWRDAEDRPGWAMRAVLGMAAVIAVGGVLCLAHLARRPVALTLIAGGLVLAWVSVSGWWATAARAPATNGHDWHRRSVPGAVASIASALIWVLLLVHCFAAVAESSLHPFDDVLAYAVHPRVILETGTLIDPFGVRRMSSYGGQSYLLSLVLAADDGTHLKLLDGGLAVLMLAGLVLGSGRRRPLAARMLVLAAAAFLLTMPGQRFNLAPLLSGAPFFLAIILLLARDQPSTGWRRALLLALPAAAVATLRQSYLVPVAVLLVAALASPIVRANQTERGRALKELTLTAALSAGLLLPWAVLAWISHSTPLFPLIPGNLNRAYEPLSPHGGGGASWPFVAQVVGHAEPIVPLALALLFVAALVVGDARPRRPLLAAAIAGGVGFAAILVGFPLSDAPNIGRYTVAFLLPLALAVPLTAGQGLANAGRTAHLRSMAAALLAVLALLAQGWSRRGPVYESWSADVNQVLIASGWRRPTKPAHRRGPASAVMQSAIPVGAGLAVMVDDPRGLDFRRNRIALIDLPGAASPPPGMPIGAGADALASYLNGLGYRYLAFVRPSLADDGLYRRRRWLRLLHAGEPIWRLSAPFYLGAFDDMEALLRTRRSLYDDGRNVLIDLAPSSSPAS